MKIYFYDNNIREFCLTEPKHQALLERVATRTCVTADNWEPLSGTNGLYSVRTNGKDRLLFIYIEDTLNNNKTAMLVWRHIPHNYNPIIKTFKKSKNLSNFKLSEEPVPKDEIEETKDKPEFSEAYGEFKEASGLNNYFVLDNMQNEAVYKPFPVILEGGPGSGKTTVLLTILEQQLALLQDKKILCLSKSKFLIDAITEEWTLSPLYDAHKGLVDITTYEAFFEEVLRKAHLPLNHQSEKFKAWLPIRLQNKNEKLAYKNLKLVKICTENADDEELKLQLAFAELREEFQAQVFSEWFQERFSNKSNKRKKGRKPTFSIEDSNLVYEEFRIASGYKDQASYVKSGDKQSSLNVNQRDALYAYYTQWVSYLKANQLHISDFFDLTPYLGNIQDQYSKLLIDEGQDFSHLQLNLLVKLLPAGQFVVCVDQRQNLFDSNPKSIYLKNIINEHCRTDNPIEPLVLPNAYRCPGEVMRFAVLVFNELRRQFTPVTKQEAPIEILQNNEGRVVLLDPKHLSSEEDKREFALLQEKTKSIDTCIITNETNFDDAERLFPDFIKRFIPKQAKGLGTKCVILLNPLNHEFFHEINKLLSNGGLTNLPKAAKYCTLLSEWFVAATRAELEVYMVQENMDSHNLLNIKKLIESVINTNKAPEHIQEPVTITTSTPEELKQEAMDLYRKGLQEEAFDILIKRVKMSKEDAFALLNESITENVAQQKTKALHAIKKGDLHKIRQIFSDANSVLFGSEDSTDILKALVSSTKNRLEMLKIVLNSQKITDVYKLLDYIYEKNSPKTAVEIIDLLVIADRSCAIDWNHQSTNKNITALMLTCKENSDLSFNFFSHLMAVKNVDVTLFDSSGCSALFHAILYKNTKIFRYFLLDSINSNAKDSFEATALTSDLEKIKLLITNFEFLLDEFEENIKSNTNIETLIKKSLDIKTLESNIEKSDIAKKLMIWPRQIAATLFPTDDRFKLPSPAKITGEGDKKLNLPFNVNQAFSLAIKFKNINLIREFLKSPAINIGLIPNIKELLDFVYDESNTVAIEIIDLLMNADHARTIDWNYQGGRSKLTALIIACKAPSTEVMGDLRQYLDKKPLTFSPAASAVVAESVNLPNPRKLRHPQH